MSDSEDNSSVEQHNDSDDRNDEERMAIRSQLSTLSFEELQKLKEKIGAKVYKEALFGNKMKDNKPKVFKRDNKNRPREMSSKKPVPMLQATKVKKKEIRDPSGTTGRSPGEAVRGSQERGHQSRAAAPDAATAEDQETVV
ncbi:hypothetical protein O3G_MSEX014236 [Manduca sexta]|uniref:Uncharacterized protein n=1 Tax=Manduca sexta TaxID=7130 RepID=A0A922CY16_MANSE|nr:hypothetical protein O3G_MSEX014236 [Manduca sexta]